MKNLSTDESTNTLRLKRAYTAIEALDARLSRDEYERSEPIAVVGMGCRFPGGANNPAQYWRLLHEGVNAICRVPSERWDADHYYDPDPTRQGKINNKKGGFLDHDVYAFDPTFFGISPKETLQLDPQQRLLLEVVWEALEDAQIVPDHLYGSSTGVFVGISSIEYAIRQLGMQLPSEIGAYVGTGALLSPAAGRISYVLGLTGPSTVVDTACSSSLLAVHLACQSLRSGESDLALTAGVNLLLDPESSCYFSTAGMLADDGHCKTFDTSADGYVRAEGCGAVVLKRLSDARADGDRVLALIRGSATNHVGPSGGLTVPSRPSQEQVIRKALKQAGLAPQQVDYVEAHGTGTSIGDPIEVGALGAIFAANHSTERPLYIGSAKTNVGHSEAASGMVGLIKVILALQHREIPPNLHYRNPNPQIPWETLPIKVVTENTPWAAVDKTRVAGITAYGFSGTNVHIVVGEAPVVENAPAPSQNTRSYHILPISAKSDSALRIMAASYQQHLQNIGENKLPSTCYAAAAGRNHFQYRLALVADETATLVNQLGAFASGENSTKLAYANSGSPADIAFLFTGQGSQYVGMGRMLYQTQSLFRQTLEHCAEVLLPALPIPLLDVILADGESLNKSQYAQPALFAVEYALYQMWVNWGIKPAAVMGHSLGEYVAACVAGVFSLEDGLMLVTERGRLMDELASDGIMAAIYVDAETVAATLMQRGDQVSISAFNSSQNTVVSGGRAPVENLVTFFTAEGIATEFLPARDYHSSLLEPVLAEFADVLQMVTFSHPQLDIVSNLTGRRIGSELSSPHYWLDQMRHPVQFAAGLDTLYQQGCRHFIEVGPGPTLLDLARPSLDAELATFLPTLHPEKDDWRQVLQSLAYLYSVGVSVDWQFFVGTSQHEHVSLPTYAFQRRHYSLDRPEQDRRPSELGWGRPHPLIDRQVQSELLNGDLFETFFHVRSQPQLEDYRIHDKLFVSGARYLSLVLGAVNLLYPGAALALTEIYFQQDLVVPARGCLVQLGIDPEKKGIRSFQLVTNTDAGNETTTHVVGSVSRDTLALSEQIVDIESIWERCDQKLTASAVYQIQRNRHIELGPSYRWITECGRGDGEAICRIELPTAVTDAAHYQLPPGLLDACFGLFAVCTDSAVDDPFIPLGIEELHFFKTPQEFPLHAHLRQRLTDITQKRLGDLQIVDATGAIVAQVIGISGRKATREQLQNATRIAVRLREAKIEERADLLAMYLKSEVARVLDLDDLDSIESQQRLFDLGIDSLMAVELRDRLKTELDYNLSATLLFDYPSLEVLVPHLLDEIGLGENEPLDSTGVDLIAADIEELSESEAEALLLQELEKTQGD